MRVALQPLIRWFRVQRPATAALITRPHLRLRHGLTARKTQHRRGGVVHRQACRACLSTSSSLTEQSSETARVLKLARQATLQALPPQSVVGKILHAVHFRAGTRFQPASWKTYVQVKVQGHGKQMGMQVAWQLVIGHDGACMQHVHGKELSFRWGTEGVSNPNAWEVRTVTVDLQACKTTICMTTSSGHATCRKMTQALHILCS